MSTASIVAENIRVQNSGYPRKMCIAVHARFHVNFWPFSSVNNLTPYSRLCGARENQ